MSMRVPSPLASTSSVDDVPSEKNINTLDLVYDIIADLSRSDIDSDWVDMNQVVSMAGHKATSKEQVHEVIEPGED